MPTQTDRFARSLVRAEDRLLIYSICRVCREEKIVSDMDGSLDEWEKDHRCKREAVPSVSDVVGKKST